MAAARASGHHAIEHVDATRHRFEDVSAPHPMRFGLLLGQDRADDVHMASITSCRSPTASPPME